MAVKFLSFTEVGSLPEERVLEKANRMNLLIDFYEPLLTEKQRTFLKFYFHDDYSLGEIAENFEISRQAVYEHIKRAEQALEDYEAKLLLINKHEQRAKLTDELTALLQGSEPELKKQLTALFDTMIRID
jgi:predicted DNA-binding protein YlxM (UPF0122 family)